MITCCSLCFLNLYNSHGEHGSSNIQSWGKITGTSFIRITLIINKEVELMVETNNPSKSDAVSIEPTVFACYRNGWRQMKRYFLESLLLVAVSLVLLSLSGLPLSTEYSQIVSNNVPRQTSLFAVLYLILLYEPISYGISYAFLKAARGESPDISSVLEVLKNYTSAVMARLLCFTIVGLGLALLIIPGILFGCRLAFVRYLIVEEKFDSIESVRISWRLTKGHTTTIFGIGLTAVLIYLLGLIAFGAGIILSIIWVKLAFASVYHAVTTDNEELKNYSLHRHRYKENDPDYESGVSGGSHLRNMLDEKE